MGVSIRSGCDQLVIEVAANERHEGAASGMDPANRQLSGQVGNLRVIARKNFELQLGGGLDGQIGVLLAEPGRLGFAAAIDAEQDQWGRASRGRRGMVGFCSHDFSTPWNQKGTRSGSLGFTGYGSFDSGSERWPSRFARQNGRN